VGKILKKLYVKNRRQAVERAKEFGILGGDALNFSTRKTNLPSSMTPFIGRSGELGEIRQQLGKTRLLTLTGPGGMGKTRLALKTAEDAVDDFKDGCFFVSLAPIGSVDHIVQTIAEAVNFPIPTNEDPKHQLLRYLQKKNLLLIMDNFEHLMNGAGIVSEILQNTSGVKVLATSRERLNLKSETALSIVGMSEGNKDAVALFLQSGSKAQPGFEPSPDELNQVENICRSLGGMPLAIELAASWLHVLSVNEIYDELQKGLDILETEVRDAPERHRSIRTVFEQSWSLLNENEQEIFICLSVFRGGFTREAAEQVARASLRQIAGLVNKSILRHDPNTGRLEIHELLRQYGEEKLEETPHASNSTKKTYAAYYADFMQEKWRQIQGPEQISMLAEIEADIENVRSAWRFHLENKDALQMEKFLYSFWRVFWVRGWIHSAVELFRDGVVALTPIKGDSKTEAVRAVAMAFQGYFMSWEGLAGDGYKLIKESIQILERLDEPIGLAFAYNSMTLAAYYTDRTVEQRNAALHFLRFAESSDDKWSLGDGLWLASIAEFRMKNYQESKRLVDASLKAHEEIDNIIGLAACYASLGQLAMNNGDYPEAKKYYTRCLQLAKMSNLDWFASNAIKYLGENALLTNNTSEAEEYLVQSIQTAYDLGLERDIANLLYDFANLRAAQNRLEEGVELISLLLQQPASHLARLGGGLISDRAKELLSELEKKLAQEKFEAALKRGESLDMDKVVLGLLGSKA
jgi:predicted ATPase